MSRTSSTSGKVALLALVLCLAAGTMLVGCGKKTGSIAAPAKKVVKKAPAPVVYTWPFKGTTAPDEASTKVRPLSIKIENSIDARPQKGLNSADVVYETIAEGGITRFNCIFQSHVPKEVGPVRSARLSDCWIVPQYNTMLYFSGANSQVLARVKRLGLDNMSQNKAAAAYHRVSFRKAPHNLYLSPKKSISIAKKHGYAMTSDAAGLAYGVESKETSTAATVVRIPFSYYATVRWVFDPATNTYLRNSSEKKYIDASTGDQVRAKNVVVMWAQYTPQKKKDAAGSITYDITLGGSGKCSVFRDGARYDGTWNASRTHVPTFKDAAGKTITLNPGNTWFEVPPTDIKIKTKSGK